MTSSTRSQSRLIKLMILAAGGATCSEHFSGQPDKPEREFLAFCLKFHKAHWNVNTEAIVGQINQYEPSISPAHGLSYWIRVLRHSKVVFE